MHAQQHVVAHPTPKECFTFCQIINPKAGSLIYDLFGIITLLVFPLGTRKRDLISSTLQGYIGEPPGFLALVCKGLTRNLRETPLHTLRLLRNLLERKPAEASEGAPG